MFGLWRGIRVRAPAPKRMPRGEVGDDFGDPEVGDLWNALGVEQNVGGLQVAVDDLRLVGVSQPVEYGDADALQIFLPLQGFTHQRAEVGGHPLEDQIALVAFGVAPDVEKLDDVRVTEAHQSLRFPFEGNRRGAFVARGAQDLDGDDAALVIEVCSSVDTSHSARLKFPRQGVATIEYALLSQVDQHIY